MVVTSIYTNHPVGYAKSGDCPLLGGAFLQGLTQDHREALINRELWGYLPV